MILRELKNKYKELFPVIIILTAYRDDILLMADAEWTQQEVLDKVEMESGDWKE